MQIAIEALYLGGNKFGVGRYLYNLIRLFPEISDDHDYYLYSDGRPIDPIIVHEKIHYQILKGPLLLWKHLLLPIEQRKKQHDILFIPSYTAPLLSLGKCVVTIHDVIPYRYPEWSTKSERLRFAVLVKYAARRANYIIADSDSTRKDILQMTGVANNKVVVIYAGVEDHFRPISTHEISEFKNTYNLDQPFILHVGAIHPRRNIKRLIEAFAHLKKEKKIEHKLVLIGTTFHAQMTSQLSSWIKQSQVADQIVTYDYISEDDLIKCYNSADIFIYPSLYEGFGLPVLEAMACGTPTITSNSSSLSEVAGDAALLINPQNESEIADAIHQLVRDQQLRNDLVSRGFARCKQFSWKKTAAETLDVFEKTNKF